MSDIDWDAVYDEQTPRLYNFFRYRVGDGELAQDLTAQTMMKAWQYRHSYRHDVGAFAAWLFRIARNLAIDHLKRQRHTPLPLYNVAHHASDISVEREVQKSLDASRLYCVIQTLPAREQEIIALKYGADMTNREIADLLDLSASNVGTILSRTIQIIRAKWELDYVKE
ncbi:MAG: sigma-70 family RNA polymerase sigma factor [Chloroflexota bacterium]